MHHIAGDERSFEIFWRDMASAYAAIVQRESPALQAPAVSYAELAAQQRARLSGPALEKKLTYWKQKLAGVPARTELPYRAARPHRSVAPPRLVT